MTGVDTAHRAALPSAGETQRVREETSLFGFACVVLRYRRMIALFVLIFGALGLLRFVQATPKYETRVGFNVNSSNNAPEATTLASQLTLAIGGGHGESEVVSFFSELVRSPPLLRVVADAIYTVQTRKGRVTGPLARFYGLSGPTRLHDQEMIDVLTDNITLTPSYRTGNIWILVDAPYPELSRDIAANLVAELDKFSRNRRHSEIAAERDFIQARLAEARASLSAAEDRVVEFQVNNRDASSPSLRMTVSQLSRDVTMKQQLYTSLMQSYDRARIEEVKNLPAITMLEPPEQPLEPEPSSDLSMPLLGAIAGLLIGMMLAFIRERMAETSAAPTPAFEYYRELKGEALRDLRHPLRPVNRLLRSPPDA